MIRSLCMTIVIIAAVLWLPFLVQVGLFLIAALLMKYKALLFVPAMLADVLYAPTMSLLPQHYLTTIFVALVLLVRWLIISKTRVQHLYGVETK